MGGLACQFAERLERFEPGPGESLCKELVDPADLTRQLGLDQRVAEPEVDRALLDLERSADLLGRATFDPHPDRGMVMGLEL
jgi:hypothetical protein